MLTHVNRTEIQTLFRIVEECGELHAHPTAWQTHLLTEVGKLLRLPVGLLTELRDFEPGKVARMEWAFETGWEDAQQRAAFFSPQRMDRGPFSMSPLDLRFREALPAAAQATQARIHVMDRAAWHATDAFNLIHAPARMDEVIYDAVRLDDTDHFSVMCFGGKGTTPGEREVQILSTAHGLIAARLGTRLLKPTQSNLEDLPKRLQQIYALLLDGLAEKEIAHVLGITPTTVNEHVQRLYRQLGVQSRAHLMAMALKRRSARRE